MVLKRWLSVLLLAPLALALPSAASAAATPCAAAMSAAVRAQMAKDGSYGLAVAVLRGGRSIYTEGLGERQRNGVAVDPGTHFEIGSDTKQFVAAAVLQLKEAGQLDLGDSLARYAPDFPHASEITIRELLDQTTGLFDYVSTNHFLAMSQSGPGSLARIERMASGPLAFVPGSKWAYSNTNYIALARVVEVVSGETYKAYLRRHIFAPAGLTETAFVADEQRLADMANGYWRGPTRKGDLQPSPTIPDSWLGAAGDVVSTVGDMTRWDRALMGGRIISRADVALMMSPASLTDGAKDDYGFGWWIDPIGGHTDVYHDGDTLGMSSSNDYFPDDDLWIVVLENQDTDSAARAARAAFTAFSHEVDCRN